jgi:hypothetical protein
LHRAPLYSLAPSAFPWPSTPWLPSRSPPMPSSALPSARPAALRLPVPLRQASDFLSAPFPSRRPAGRRSAPSSCVCPSAQPSRVAPSAYRASACRAVALLRAVCRRFPRAGRELSVRRSRAVLSCSPSKLPYWLCPARLCVARVAFCCSCAREALCSSTLQLQLGLSPISSAADAVALSALRACSSLARPCLIPGSLAWMDGLLRCCLAG